MVAMLQPPISRTGVPILPNRVQTGPAFANSGVPMEAFAGAAIDPLTGAPPTGLIGSEMALLSGLGGAENAITSTTDAALRVLRSGRNTGIGELRDAVNLGMGNIQAGVDRGMRAIGGGVSAINRGTDRGIGFLEQGISGFEPIAQQGTAASGVQAALSGALGPAALQRALDSLQPINSFLQDRGERAVLRNAAALGGTGGGAVQQELVRFGQGLASQDQQRQFENLSTVANRGLSALGAIGDLRGQQGDLSLRGGIAAGDLRARGGELAFRGGESAGNLAARGGESILGARLQANAGLADLLSGAGKDIATGRFETGRDLSRGRTRAGEVLSELDLLDGTNAAAAAGNLASVLSGTGGQLATSDTNLAQLLANLASGAGGQVAGLPGIPGVQQQQGILGGLGQLAGGVGTLLGAI